MWSFFNFVTLKGQIWIWIEQRRIRTIPLIRIWKDQRIYSDRRDIVLQRCDSPNLSPLCLQYTLLPDWQAGRGWVSQIFVRRWPVLSLLSLINILCSEVMTMSFKKCLKSKSLRYSKCNCRNVSILDLWKSTAPNICTCIVFIIYIT